MKHLGMIRLQICWGLGERNLCTVRLLSWRPSLLFIVIVVHQSHDMSQRLSYCVLVDIRRQVFALTQKSMVLNLGHPLGTRFGSQQTCDPPLGTSCTTWAVSASNCISNRVHHELISQKPLHRRVLRSQIGNAWTVNHNEMTDLTIQYYHQNSARQSLNLIRHSKQCQLITPQLYQRLWEEPGRALK